MGIKRKTLDEFKQDLFNKFENEYTVLDDKYINNKTEILVRHNICNNDFKVRPDMILHNYKQGCPFCNSRKLKTNEKFLEELDNLYHRRICTIGTL